MRFGRFEPHDHPLRLPSFDRGGTVPGAPGEPQVIVAHGGERVEPAEMVRPASAGGGRIVEHSITIQTSHTIHAVGEVHLTRDLEHELDEWADERDADAARRVRQGVFD